MERIVSIIIPCFNGERFVAEAIGSALGQTYRNREVIVIDDGSTDGSVDVIKSFGDRIRWEASPNRGACAARNRGVELANGEFIQFLDADDVLLPAKIESQMPFFSQHVNAIPFCNWKQHGETTVAAGLSRRVDTSNDSVIRALRSVISTPAPLYPVEQLHQIGRWDESLPCAQDYDLNLRLACQGVMFIDTPDVQVELRHVPGSLSSNMERILDQFGVICGRAYHDLRDRSALTEERAAAFSGVMASHARTYLRHGLVEKARAVLRKRRTCIPPAVLIRLIGPGRSGCGAFSDLLPLRELCNSNGDLQQANRHLCSDMTDPLVSIIIPTFNGEEFVAVAIESALRQSYRPLEVIVVDDGSTDNTVDVVRSFGDAVRLTVGPNSGVAAARNRGAQAARGDLLQFLDQDDELDPYKLEKQVPLAIEHRGDVVICDAAVVDWPSGQRRGKWGVGSVSTSDPVVHAFRTTAQTSGPLHWRETFDRVGGFREDTPPCDDRDLMLRLAIAGVKFHHLPEELYVWHCRNDSQSKTNLQQGLRMEQRIGVDAMNSVEMIGRITEQRRSAFAVYFMSVGRRAVRHGLNDLAEECFQLAKSIHPQQGFQEVYSPSTRLIARLFGPRMTEKLIMCKRKLFREQGISDAQ